MLLDFILLIVGFAMLIVGADFFVEGSSNIAKALRIPSLIIGLTLVSIGTSLPETSVSLNSAINGMNDMSIGNVVGSDIFNTLFILGVSALIIPLLIDSDMRKFDIPIMFLTYGAFIVFCFVITPYVIDGWEGVILIALFAAYLAFLIFRAIKSHPEMMKSDDAAENRKKKKPLWLSVILVVAGLAGIIFGGDFVVGSASSIAVGIGMSEALVGLTIVAVGTSLPELVTSIVAAVKKENDIAVGNLVGSNIYNILFVLGLSASINPLAVGEGTLFDTLVMLGSGLTLMLIALFSKKVNKWSGVLMFLMYAGYLTYIIIRN